MSGETEFDLKMHDEDEERHRQSERRLEEEALEVKSLRRIISAYLNYPEAAEDDVRRWERSFRNLPPAHKALLSHYPSKFKKLRRCISMNSYFIFAMLQAFDPPLDMSLDTDICEDPHVSHTLSDNELFGLRAFCCHSASTSGRMCYSEGDQAYCKEQSDAVGDTQKEIATNEITTGG